MDLKLNLDALRKELGGKRGTSTSPGAQTGQQTTTGSIPAPATTKVTLVEKPKVQMGGVQLVSLEGPRLEVKKEGGLKLVSLDQAQKKPASSPLLAAQQDSSVPLKVAEGVKKSTKGIDDIDESILKEMSPVFKNLTKDSHHNWQELRKRYEKYKKARRKKMLMTSSYSLAAMIMLAFIAFPMLSKPEETKVSVTQTANWNINTNINSDMTVGIQLVNGDTYIQVMEGVFPVMPPLKTVFENQFKGKTTVSNIDAIVWGMIVSQEPILLPVNPNADPNAYIWKFAKKNLILEKKEEIESPLTVLTLDKLMQTLKEKKYPDSPGAPSTGSGSVQP